jgi:hypothetical protein
MEAFKIFQSFKISHFYLGSIEGMVSMMFKAPKPEVKMCRLSQMHFLDRVGFLFLVNVFESFRMFLKYDEHLNALNVLIFADFCGIFWTLPYPRLV